MQIYEAYDNAEQYVNSYSDPDYLHSQLQSELNNTDSSVNDTKKLIEQNKLMIHDGYDSFAQHLIVKDLIESKIIAYVRIIDAFTAFKIGGFYCETQFNVSKLFNNQKYYMEISRLSIHKDYENEHMSDTHQLITYYKKKYMSERQFRVTPYQLLSDNNYINQFNFWSKSPKNSFFNFFFKKGVRICGDAHWNKSLNLAELFIYYQVENKQVSPHCISANEVEVGLLCE